MVEEIKEKFSGKWKLDHSDNFDGFMTAMGVNFLIRKMAGMARPENDIHVEDDGTIVISTSSTFMKNEQKFKLGQEFEEINNFTKTKFKNMPTYENGCLRIVPTPVDPVNTPYPEYAERELTDTGDMCLTLKVGDVICKRYFKKIDS